MTKSLYGDRDTVGTIALEAAKKNVSLTVGDLGHELMPSLVEDLNNCIKSNPYNGLPFYIIIHEKKDLQLKNVILRRLITTQKRPYPEPNTAIFYTDPKQELTLFCWSLPHQTVFNNYIYNPDYYVKEQVEDIKAYLAEDMEHFGFRKIKTEDGKNNVVPIENFKDRRLGKEKSSLHFSVQ